MQTAEPTKHYWLYVLRLEQGKYYVGITSRKDPNERIQEHMNGFYSAQWVKRYKPIDTAEIIDIGNVAKPEAYELENHRTLQYMKKYGYQNVRGGRFNYSGRYIKVGNRYWSDQDFEVLAAVILLMAAIITLLLQRIP